MSGISQMRPNVVAMGFKDAWHEKDAQESEDYVDTIRDAFLLQCGVMIVRNIEHFDFAAKVPSGNCNVDVWWLNDDGGLTLLVPYLVTMQKKWKKAKIRVMDVRTSAAISSAQLTMQKLLSKFRIDAEPVSVPLNVDAAGQFGDVSERVRGLHDSFFEDDDEPRRPSKRTQRHLRMADVIYEESKDASLVVISVPVPEVGLDARTYLSWLDCLSRDLPPVILVRGNQQNVLTWDL